MEKLNWANQIKFLCFDIDGTLYRNVPAVWNAIQSQIYEVVCRQKKITLKQAAQYVKNRYQQLGSSTKLLNELGIDGEEFFTKAFENINLTKYVPQDPELIKLIANLKQKYKLGIISNTHLTIATKKLAALGVSISNFDPVITTYELGAYKPDPAPFLKSLELAQVKPEEAVYIGDSLESDILGAHAVGMLTILVWDKSPEADLSIPTIYDLEKYFL